MAMTIVADICTACGDCEPDCPTSAIFPHKGVYAIDASKCTECEGEHDAPKCVELCFEDGCIIPAE